MAHLSARDLPQYRAQLVGLARHLGLSHAAAEDAAQSCLLAVLHRLRAGAQISEPQAYLNTALRNQCHRHLRRQGRETEFTEQHEQSVGDAEDTLLLQEVLTALHRLPTAQAALLLRVAGGETSPQALAAEAGLPVGTIMSRLARGRTALRALLDLGSTAD